MAKFVIVVENTDGDVEYYWPDHVKTYSDARDYAKKVIKGDFYVKDIDSVTLLSVVEDITTDVVAYIEKDDE